MDVTTGLNKTTFKKHWGEVQKMYNIHRAVHTESEEKHDEFEQLKGINKSPFTWDTKDVFICVALRDIIGSSQKKQNTSTGRALQGRLLSYNNVHSLHILNY